MADEDAEIIVSLETEGDGGITKVEPARDETGKFVAKETEPSEDLAAQFKAEAESAREHAAAAERQSAADRQDADKARREAAAARTEASDSQLDTVSTGLAAAQTEADAATAAYQSAMEAGDFAAAAKAQRRMASAEAKIGRLDEAKADLEARKVERPAERTERTETKNTDPVEAYLATRTEPTAKWLRDHRDYLTDPKKNAKLIAAHHDAISEDIALDSTKYFAHIEQFVGLKKAEPEAKTNATIPAKRRSTVPVAPVQQSGGSGGEGGTRVALTKGEYAAATDGVTHTWNYDDPSPQKRFKKGDPLGAEEFARRKLALQKSGAYDRTFTES